MAFFSGVYALLDFAMSTVGILKINEWAMNQSQTGCSNN
jgi:hypothetical protein